MKLRGIEHTGQWDGALYVDSLGVRWFAQNVMSFWSAVVEDEADNVQRAAEYITTEAHGNGRDELQAMIDRIADDAWTRRIQADSKLTTDGHHYTDENGVEWILRPSTKPGSIMWLAYPDLAEGLPDDALPYSPQLTAPSAEDMLLKVRTYAAAHRVPKGAPRPWVAQEERARVREGRGGGGALALFALFAFGGKKKRGRRRR
jgi:hypothetical protein